MLNGVDPIILFNFKKIPASLEKVISGIPLVASIVEAIDLPVIPLYLNESLTGIFIDSESKGIEVDTSIDTKSNGDTPEINQRGLTNTIKIEMQARADSIGVSIFSAMSDLIFPKLTSKEYSITYLHGAIVGFACLIHSFNITQNSNDDRYNITLELIKTTGSTAKAASTKGPVVEKSTGTVPSP